MLQIKFNDTSIMPMRSDSLKTFASADVPHGTDAVIYKAAKVLNQDHRANIALPRFTEEQVQARVSTQKAKLSFVDTSLDEEGNPKETLDTSIEFHLQTKLMPPSAEMVQKKLDELRGYSDKDVQDYIVKNSKPEIKTPAVKDLQGNVVTPEVVTQQAVVITEAQAIAALKKPSFGSMPGMPAPADPTLASAEVALKDEMKQSMAESQVKFIHDNCLEVPELSEDFKAQFNLVEVQSL